MRSIARSIYKYRHKISNSFVVFILLQYFRDFTEVCQPIFNLNVKQLLKGCKYIFP